MGSEQHPARWSGTGKRSVRAYEAEPAPAAPLEPAPAPEPTPEPEPAPEPEPQPDEGPLATDAARDLAFKHGIALEDVTGTGAEGRITRDDVAALVHTPGD